MRTHKETYNINANKETIFNVIANIENYPTFLPWCIGARLTETYELSDIIGTCQPNQERALIFKSFIAVASNADVTCSPVDKTTSYSG